MSRRGRFLLILAGLVAVIGSAAFAAFEFKRAFVAAAESPKGQATPAVIVNALGPARWRGP